MLKCRPASLRGADQIEANDRKTIDLDQDLGIVRQKPLVYEGCSQRFEANENSLNAAQSLYTWPELGSFTFSVSYLPATMLRVRTRYVGRFPKRQWQIRRYVAAYRNWPFQHHGQNSSAPFEPS